MKESARWAWASLAGRGENPRWKLGLHLGLGLAVAHLPMLVWILTRPPTGHESIVLETTQGRAVYSALYLAWSVLVPLVIPALVTFPAALLLHLGTRGSRARLRQALVCPFCRDEVGQEDALLCARSGCGALYHRECWDECATQYGGCAVYGCSSRRSLEVTPAGFALRTARLLMAALLFTPKVARALRDSEQEGFRAIFKRAVQATKIVGLEHTLPGWKAALYVFGAVPAAYLLMGKAVERFVPHGFMGLQNLGGWTQFGLLLLVSLIPLVLPRLVALPLTLVFFLIRGLARAFKSELAALNRADEGGGSVLGRLRAGLGAKKDPGG